MPYSLVGTPVAAFSPGGGGTFTSGVMDTTGANLLVVLYGDAGTIPTVTDSNGNNWIQAINDASPMLWHSAIFYSYYKGSIGTPITVGSGHTITLTGSGTVSYTHLRAHETP